jgi:YD repeat-containing protein
MELELELGFEAGGRAVAAGVIKLSTVANGSGHEVDYGYDQFDRITQEIYKNAGGATTETLTYTYDPDGNLTQSTELIPRELS